MQKQQMLSAIQACDPCQDQAWLREGAAHWPDDVTLSWLLRNPARGDREVSARHRRWLAVAMLHKHAPARLAVALAAIAARAEKTSDGWTAAKVWASRAAFLAAQAAEKGAKLQDAFEVLGAALRAARAMNRHREEVELQNADFAAAADGFI